MAKLSSQARNNLSDSDFAYIDSNGGRHLPIHDASHVRNALSRFNQTHFESAEAKARARRKIRAAAKKFGIRVTNSALIEETELQEIVCLEFDPTSAVVSNDNGVMRLRVPFYRGNTVARPSGWTEPLFFAADELPTIIAAGRDVIREDKLRLTVYARHLHAITGGHLPIGRVVELEQVGHDGYATLEVADDGDFGTRVQNLVRQKMLNAVSLRSTSDLTLEEKKVNGELMAMPVGMRLAGIDFAPEGPAMTTFGMQILNDARVEPYTPSPLDDEEEEDNDNMGLTLEAVRAEPAIVAELEKPLRDRITALEADNKAKGDELTAKAAELKTEKDRVVALEARVAKSEVDAVVAELSGRFAKPKKAATVLAEACKNAKNRTEAMAACAPLMLELFDSVRASSSQGGKGKSKSKNGDGGNKLTPAQVLAEALNGSADGGRGQSHDDGAGRKRDESVEYAAPGLPLPA